MIKESILFVASTGLLIYFITPSDEPVKADPVPEEVQKVVTRAPQHSNDGWGYDEPENEEQSFVFGEPLVNLDSGFGETSSDDEASQSAAFSDNHRKSAGNGSVDGPMKFSPRATAGPTDH